MTTGQLTRRRFIQGSLLAATLPYHRVFAQTTAATRLEWNAFRNTAMYPVFRSAVQKMRSNTNASDPASWSFWTNSHVNYCPHSVSYFLLWHRGLTYQFEQQLRRVSGNSTLTVPYWDYYKYPTIPADFTDPTSPFYVSGRVNTSVYNALGFAAFAASLTVFPRGATDSFERQVEGRPHNPVHNLIGGQMALRTSPNDPVFWIHHSNIDRLWEGWVAADNGRQMPPSTDPYWTGTLTYSPTLTMSRSSVRTISGLGYRYDNVTLPSTLPPKASAASIVRVQAPVGGASGEISNLQTSGPRATGAGRRSLGGVLNVPLNETTRAFSIPIPATERPALDAVLDNVQSVPFSGGRTTTTFRSAQVVLDNITITPEGRRGGYFYNVYLQLPGGGNPADVGEDNFLGTLGPFEIDTSLHHSNTPRVSYSATYMLAGMRARGLAAVRVTLERVSGNSSPAGRVITIGEARLELSSEPDE